MNFYPSKRIPFWFIPRRYPKIGTALHYILYNIYFTIFHSTLNSFPSLFFTTLYRISLIHDEETRRITQELRTRRLSDAYFDDAAKLLSEKELSRLEKELSHSEKELSRSEKEASEKVLSCSEKKKSRRKYCHVRRKRSVGESIVTFVERIVGRTLKEYYRAMDARSSTIEHRKAESRSHRIPDRKKS